MSRNADNLSPILSSMIACAVGSCEGGPISSHQVVQNLSFTLGLDLQVLQLLKLHCLLLSVYRSQFYHHLNQCVHQLHGLSVQHLHVGESWVPI